MPAEQPTHVIHLVRHGETQASRDGMLCGDLDFPLTEIGKAQARLVAGRVAKFPLRAVYVSPKVRARQTSEPICEAIHREAIEATGLREISYGEWEGEDEHELAKSDARFVAWMQDPAMNAPPHGENAYAIAARSVAVLTQAIQVQEGHLLFVSHKATIRVVLCALLGIPLARFRDRIACPVASLTTLELGPRGPLLTRLGDTGHLAGDQHNQG